MNTELHAPFEWFMQMYILNMDGRDFNMTYLTKIKISS